MDSIKPEEKELAPAWWDIGLCPITGFKNKGSFRAKQLSLKKEKTKSNWPKV